MIYQEERFQMALSSKIYGLFYLYAERGREFVFFIARHREIKRCLWFCLQIGLDALASSRR